MVAQRSRRGVGAYLLPRRDDIDVTHSASIERDDRSMDCELQRDYDFMIRN